MYGRYKSPDQLVHDMLYGTFPGNEATRWGSAHEHIACDEYQIVMRSRLDKTQAASFHVEHSGLNVHKEFSESAFSTKRTYPPSVCPSVAIFEE